MDGWWRDEWMDEQTEEDRGRCVCEAAQGRVMERRGNSWRTSSELQSPPNIPLKHFLLGCSPLVSLPKSVGCPLLTGEWFTVTHLDDDLCSAGPRKGTCSSVSQQKHLLLSVPLHVSLYHVKCMFSFKGCFYLMRCTGGIWTCDFLIWSRMFWPVELKLPVALWFSFS